MLSRENVKLLKLQVPEPISTFQNQTNCSVVNSPDANGDEELAAHSLFGLQPGVEALHGGQPGQQLLLAPHQVGDVGGPRSQYS